MSFNFILSCDLSNDEAGKNVVNETTGICPAVCSHEPCSGSNDMLHYI